MNHIGSLSVDKDLSYILLDHTNRHNIANIQDAVYAEIVVCLVVMNLLYLSIAEHIIVARCTRQWQVTQEVRKRNPLIVLKMEEIILSA